MLERLRRVVFVLPRRAALAGDRLDGLLDELLAVVDQFVLPDALSAFWTI
jgi:hypothetical protein